MPKAKTQTPTFGIGKTRIQKDRAKADSRTPELNGQNAMMKAIASLEDRVKALEGKAE